MIWSWLLCWTGYPIYLIYKGYKDQKEFNEAMEYVILQKKKRTKYKKSSVIFMSKFCPKCGLENEEEAKFCKRCGSSLDAQVQSKSSRNVLIIVVVAIFCVAAIAGTIIYLNADSDFN